MSYARRYVCVLRSSAVQARTRIHFPAHWQESKERTYGEREAVSVEVAAILGSNNFLLVMGWQNPITAFVKALEWTGKKLVSVASRSDAGVAGYWTGYIWLGPANSILLLWASCPDQTPCPSPRIILVWLLFYWPSLRIWYVRRLSYRHGCSIVYEVRWCNRGFFLKSRMKLGLRSCIPLSWRGV